jgi:membrane protein
MLTRQQLWGLLQSSASRWSAHNAPRLGASLAYYGLLSMAPLLILIVFICGLVLNRNTAEQQLLEQVRSLTGPSGARTVSMLINNAHHVGSGIIAAAAALVTLLFGASGVFVDLRDSLNIIWDVPRRDSSTWRSVIMQRLVSFGMVIGLGILMLASLIMTAMVTVAENFFSGFLPAPTAWVSELANFLISLIAIAVLFGLIFKFVPDAPIAWRDVWIGAVATAILFDIGKALLAFYLGTAGIGSTYGAAGSVVALVVWVYYSAQIFFFGAIFTKVYAERFGSHARGQKSTPPLAASASSGSA